MTKPASTGKPAKAPDASKPTWAGNAGGAVRGLARAAMVGRGKKLGLTKKKRGV